MPDGTLEVETRRVMEEMPYGLYVVGSVKDGEVNGMMADWVMQVSFQPRMVAVAFENDAHTLGNIRGNNVFTVNLLSQDDDSMELAGRFAQPYFGAKVKGRREPEASAIHRKLDNIRYRKTERGCPLLEAAMAWLECEAEQFIPVGDHTLIIGRVVDGRVERDSEPLTSAYTGWPYAG